MKTIGSLILLVAIVIFLFLMPMIMRWPVNAPFPHRP